MRALGVRLESGGPGAAWIESVAALVSRKPMDAWSDGDADAFALQIADLGRRFRLTEQLAVVAQRLPGDATVLRVGIADGRGERSVTSSACLPIRSVVDYSGVLGGITSSTQRLNVLDSPTTALADGHDVICGKLDLWFTTPTT